MVMMGFLRQKFEGLKDPVLLEREVAGEHGECRRLLPKSAEKRGIGANLGLAHKAHRTCACSGHYGLNLDSNTPKIQQTPGPPKLSGRMRLKAQIRLVLRGLRCVRGPLLLGPFKPVYAEQFDRVLSSFCSVAAIEMICRAVFIASPTNSLRMLGSVRNLRHRYSY